jgi:putative glycerol-1-phosphate prenyltransferase
MKKKFTLVKSDKKLALLIDPDWAMDKDWLATVIKELNQAVFDVILIGGSLVFEPNKMNTLILEIKEFSNLPIYLFPGNVNQVCKEADGILFISLISGRNSEFLIGQHVTGAPLIKSLGLNVLPTGYMIIGDTKTSAHYISQTQAIPYNKPSIALATAMAGEMLGLKVIYIDGGSGADRSPSNAMIKNLSNELSIPLIVGGGINNRFQIDEAFASGANLVVIGTSIEKNPGIISELRKAVAFKN